MKVVAGELFPNLSKFPHVATVVNRIDDDGDRDTLESWIKSSALPVTFMLFVRPISDRLRSASFFRSLRFTCIDARAS